MNEDWIEEAGQKNKTYQEHQFVTEADLIEAEQIARLTGGEIASLSYAFHHSKTLKPGEQWTIPFIYSCGFRGNIVIQIDGQSEGADAEHPDPRDRDEERLPESSSDRHHPPTTSWGPLAGN